MYSINICKTASGYSYYVTVVRPDGLTVSATYDTLFQCWELAELTIKSFERERAR
jgi:hypothetical protein